MADAARNSPFTRDSPPHATVSSFEIVGESTYGPPVQQAHIVEVPTTDNEPNDDNVEEVIPNSDLFDVYATEKKKRDVKASKLPEFTQASESTAPAAASSSKTSPSTTSSGKAPASAPTSTTTNTPPSPSTSRSVPQYRYQSNAEDQRLTTELYQWLLDGKLSLVTPAHILAASPAICKELVKRLRTCRVDAAGFEESSTPPFSVLELSTPHIAEYSLPLREIDVLINDTISEAGVLDQGSQIIVIQRDLAQEAGAVMNSDHQLEMEGANGLVSKTLGCAENLSMRVGDVSFEVHAHVVDRALFRLLLGRPFHHLLLCRLEDQPDGCVDVSVHDPTDPARSISIPSRARKAQVGFVRALSFISHPTPPRFNGLWPHHNAAFEFLFQTPTEPVLAYKRVAKKVRPVPATLPEDYHIIRRIPVDPLLSLRSLPTRPPDFTPGTRLTRERLDDLNLNQYGFLLPEELKLL